MSEDEKTCANCKHFYEHGKSDWEDAPECGDCTHRGGFENEWLDINAPAEKDDSDE